MTVGQTDGLEKQVEDLEYENARLMKERHLLDAEERANWQFGEFLGTTIFTLVYMVAVAYVLMAAALGLAQVSNYSSAVVDVLNLVMYTSAKVILYLFGILHWIDRVIFVYNREILQFIETAEKRWYKLLRVLFGRV